MKEMTIYEPAMCCSTGVCGVGVDADLLRISTVLSALEKKNIEVKRYNLSNSPQAFITNKVVNNYIRTHGLDALPITVLDSEIFVSGRYPSNEEIIKFLELPDNII